MFTRGVKKVVKPKTKPSKVKPGKSKKPSKVKPKPKFKRAPTQAQTRRGGQTSPTKGQKAALGVAAAGTGTLTGLKLKQGKDAGAAPKVSGQGQSPKGGTAPKKKPAQSTKSVQSGPKKKKKLKNLDDLFVKTNFGFLKDKKGKRVKRLSREELMKRRKAQR